MDHDLTDDSPQHSFQDEKPPPWWRTWAGPAMSTVPVLVMFIDAYMKIAHMMPELTTWQTRTGLPESFMTSIGILELACVAVYVVPRTAVLGAVLLTGFLGGSTAGQLRMGGPFALSALLLAALVWAGLYLRDERIRGLLPLVKDLEA